MKTRDLLIIGGGIGGMTAAIYAARANLDVVIVEKEICGGLVNATHTVENVPSYQSIHGIELMAKCREHVESLGVEIVEVEEVLRADLAGDVKHVSTTDETYHAQTIIIATGRSPIALPVDTDFENVHYCSVCDGTAYKDKDVIVIGGGNSGFDESLYLLGLGIRSIHILEMMPRCIAAASTQDRARASGKISVHTSTRLTALTASATGKGLAQLENTQNGTASTLEVDAVFCFIGQRPNTAIFEGAIAMERGYITANADMETNVSGVFAAGDVLVKKYRQITTAMSDGTIAALNAEKYIRSRM